MDPEYLRPEGDLPQEEIPQEGSPPGVPLVSVTERPMQPSYFAAVVPFIPGFVKLELDRECNHILIRFVSYVDPPYPNLFTATLRFCWGALSNIGGELRAREFILLDGIYPKNTVLFLQANTPAAGPGAATLNAELYYW